MPPLRRTRVRDRARPKPGLRAAVLATALTLGLGALFAGMAAPERSPRSEAPPHERPTADAGADPLVAVAARLRPLHRALPPPVPADWRSGPGRSERGQTYAAWRRSRPVRARGARRVLYTQRIGDMDDARREILDRTSEFLGIYFGLPQRTLESEPVDDTWPRFSRRPSVGFGEQLSTRYVLQNVLEPVLPEDGAVLVGLTAWDLWPGQDGWNFVFGQATLHRRVGVWSLRRFGAPGPDAASRVRCLRRTLKVAAHETGHMFSIEHCLAYACNMCGSNSLEETDRHPLHLCPECLPKLCAATGCDPAARFAALEAFCARNGLAPEADLYRRSHAALRAP